MESYLSSMSSRNTSATLKERVAYQHGYSQTSQTRECSESRSSSRFSDGRTGMDDSDTDSCESYIEVGSLKTTKDDSSESFVYFDLSYLSYL